MNRDQFIETARQRFNDAKDFLHNWRVDAMDDFAFIAGKQWLEEDEAILREEKRPPITFNYSEKMIDAVVGAEVSNRQQVSYLPRGMEDSPLAELWTNAAQWVRDECNAEDEETDAFRDCLICGLGWTITRMDYDTDPDGMIDVERVDPLEVRYDPAAIKRGLSDRRYHDWLFWIDQREVKRLWPNAPDVGDEDQDLNTGVIRYGHRYQDDDEERDRHQDQVQLHFYETLEREAVYRIADPQSGQMHEIDDKTFSAIRDKLDEMGVKYARQSRKVYYRAWFANDTLLEMGKSPTQKGFVLNCMTGKRDRNKNTWYGLTRVMKDPQRWANKWLSQIMYIINSNAKGGLLAEIDAFVDPGRAQEEWARPDAITLLNEGAIDKVTQKQQAPYPSGLDKLMEFALSSLPMVTGINLEALGLANREQAGVLEQQRKQAAYGLLAPLFDALRQYRKTQGRVLLDFIHQFISDGRLIRIGGPDSAQYVALTKAPDAIEYDIIVDQSPNAPDVKDKTWDTLQQILPAMMKEGLPIPPDLLDYAPIPTALSTKWKAFIAQNANQMNPQQMQQMQQAMQQLQEENQQLKNDHTAEMMDLQSKMQLRQQELQLKIKQTQAELELKQQQAQADMQLETFKQGHQMDMENRRLEHDSAMKKKQVEGDLKVKALSAGIKDAGSQEGDGKLGLSLDMGNFEQSMQGMLSMFAQMQQQNQQAMTLLAQAISKPRKLITDAAGRPVGSAPADTLQ